MPKQKAEKADSISNLERFFAHLRGLPGRGDQIDLYRGHSDEAFRLVPSLFRRKENRKDEKNIFRELISLHPAEFQQDKNVFEQLVRMQHYALPTRLLDLTFNPLVALYFTCKGSPSRTGEFVQLSVSKRSVRYFDSDTVSCIAGLSNLTGKERDEIRSIDDIEYLNNSHAGKRLLQFIRAEKPYFLPEMRPGDLKSIQVVRPKLNNRRIIAQQGLFLLFGLTTELEDANEFDIAITRTKISATNKRALLRDLDRVNINESTLFPEVEYAAKYIMEKITPISE